MSRIPIDSVKKISIEFRNRLLELIDEQEITKAEFAKKAGVSISVINRALIYGIIPSLRPLIKIADYLNISLTYLLAETDNEFFYKSEHPITFYARLDELMKLKGTTYSKLANKMPFHKSFFYEWKNRNTLPSLEYLQTLADYFNVSIDYLLGRTDEKD